MPVVWEVFINNKIESQREGCAPKEVGPHPSGSLVLGVGDNVSMWVEDFLGMFYIQTQECVGIRGRQETVM